MAQSSRDTIMDGIIMCAGQGTRLRPLTNSIPKPLIPILGKSSLERTLEALPSQVDRIVLVVGYLAHKIRERIGSSALGRPVVYVEQDALDGTGGALRRASSTLESDRFLVLNGDDLYAPGDLARLADVSRGILVLSTILSKAEDTWQIDSAGYLVDIARAERGQTGNINVGAYCLDRAWFTTKPVLTPGKVDEWSLPHAIPHLIREGVPFTAVFGTWWRPVGTPEELMNAEQELSIQDKSGLR